MQSRRQINFVKQSQADDAILQLPHVTDQPQSNWGELYDKIAFPEGRPQSAPPSTTTDGNTSTTCPTCGGELPTDEEELKAHPNSIVHQLALGASSRAPAAVDRRRKGLKMMEKYG